MFYDSQSYRRNQHGFPYCSTHFLLIKFEQKKQGGQVVG